MVLICKILNEYYTRGMKLNNYLWSILMWLMLPEYDLDTAQNITLVLAFPLY